MVDAVFHGGDISYSVGYLAKWDFFLNMITPFASRVMLFITIGNHEADFSNTQLGAEKDVHYDDSGGECGVVVQSLLPMPSTHSSRGNPWWSYDMGLVHLIGFSSEHNFKKGLILILKI